jgi:hypothetical protein
MGKLIVVALLCVGLTAKAEVETDKAAHFGVSYAAQMVTYGLAKKALRLNRKQALIFSLFTTILVTTAAEYMGGPGSRVDGGDIKANILGAGAAAGTVLMFDF